MHECVILYVVLTVLFVSTGVAHTTMSLSLSLTINQWMAINAAFVPVMPSGDRRSLGLPQDPHDNTLLSCLSAGFLCPLADPMSLS